MTTSPSNNDMSAAKKALLEIRRLRTRLDNEVRRQVAPVAIVGCGVRLPGGITTPDEFWSFLENGRDAISEIPQERWPVEKYYNADRAHAGTMYTRSGGFLQQVDEFDPQFFGISPREAQNIDPQHRILLEVAWEALEHAGIPAGKLRGTRTGVFFGLCNSDYSRMVFRNPGDADVSAATGTESSVAAGRLSYILGLQGPSMVIDTACSSSLVALHLAVQSLRRGESDLAVVGGANAIIAPDMHINFCQAQMLSVDGRCKTFDAAADGYGRSEGCGVIVVRRLDDAIQNNDRVLAVVRGSAVNQDGKSAGLTAPNGQAQESVIRDAILDAGIDASDIEYVEAHGTGTPLGDPIEARALGSAIGQLRKKSSPLLIGSAKTNFGHLEAAAGIVGVIKTALCLDHRKICPHLNFDKANPEIPLDDLNLRVVAESASWASAESAIAGVSSFGFSGTNAHIILQSDNSRNREKPGDDSVAHILALSARSEAALQHSINRYQDFLRSTTDSFEAIARTSTAGRDHHEHRLAIVCNSKADAIKRLEEFGLRKEGAKVRHAYRREGSEKPKIVFLFPGQGTQRPGMGASLYAQFRAYADAMDEVSGLFDQFLDSDPLLDVIHSRESSDERINSSEFSQAAIFSVGYSLFRLWQSWGVTPDVVLGHSLGEYVAAVASGIVSLNDAVKLVAARVQLTRQLTVPGTMVAVFAGQEDVERLVSESSCSVDVAAINGPANIVVSGAADEIDVFISMLTDIGIDHRKLNIPYAFHSRMLDPVLDQFEEVAQSTALMSPGLAMLSNVTGDFLDPAQTTSGEFWRNHLRRPVLFQQAVRKLGDDEDLLVLEMGAHPALTQIIADQVNSSTTYLTSMNRNEIDVDCLLDAVAGMHVHGADIDWKHFADARKESQSGRRPVTLPTYPFQRARYWIDTINRPPVSPDGQRTWQHVCTTANTAAEMVPLSLSVDSLESNWSLLSDLSAHYIVEALRAKNILDEPERSASVASIMESGSVLSTYRHLIERWLRLLQRKGFLDYDSGKKVFSNAKGWPQTNIDSLLAAARERYKKEQFLVDYLQRCGEMLPSVISGEVAALETLFPAGSSDIAEKLYTEFSVSRYISGIAAAAVSGMAACFGEPVRILEIGAGTGGTTATILPALPPGRVRYCFTDISDYFLTAAAERFSNYDFLEYGILDVEKEPEVQGFADNSCDVVVATNVLHATPDLRNALQNVLRLLRSDGILVLSEATSELDWFDISTGLIEGWQIFDDDIRSDSPVIPVSIWRTALLEAGFVDVVSFPEENSPAGLVGQNVIVARGPALAADHQHSHGDHYAMIPDARNAAIADDHILRDLADAPETEHFDLLVDHVTGLVCRILRLAPNNAPDSLAGLFDLGMDSLMALDFRRRLSHGLKLDVDLPATLIFDYPNVASIARFLLSEIDAFVADADTGAAQTGDDEECQAMEAADRPDLDDLSDEEVALLIEQQLK